MRSRATVKFVDISSVRERTGLSAATLRHYETVGLIESTARVGLHRQFDDNVIEVLAVIALCQRSGFSLDEIRELLARRGNSEWKAQARAKLEDLDRRIAALEEARSGLRHAIDCRSPNIMQCEHFRHRLDTIYPKDLSR
jgi:DNA-binding transcriptional MerR regulator